MCIFKAAIAVIVAAGLSVSAANAVDDAKTLAESAEPVSVYELFTIYHNKSWLWKSGAGYFSGDERRFLAWGGSEDSPTYAEGRWYITEEGGKVCFKAVWHYRGGSKPKRSCFAHRKNGAVILQRSEPDGDWYIFKSAASTAADAFSKLKDGDHVTSKLEEQRTALSKN